MNETYDNKHNQYIIEQAIIAGLKQRNKDASEKLSKLKEKLNQSILERLIDILLKKI